MNSQKHQVIAVKISSLTTKWWCKLRVPSNYTFHNIRWGILGHYDQTGDDDYYFREFHPFFETKARDNDTELCTLVSSLPNEQRLFDLYIDECPEYQMTIQYYKSGSKPSPSIVPICVGASADSPWLPGKSITPSAKLKFNEYMDKKHKMLLNMVDLKKGVEECEKKLKDGIEQFVDGQVDRAVNAVNAFSSLSCTTHKTKITGKDVINTKFKKKVKRLLADEMYSIFSESSQNDADDDEDDRPLSKRMKQMKQEVLQAK